MVFEHRGWQLDACHELIECQVIVALGGVCGQAMEIREGYLPFTGRPLYVHHGFERSQCHAHVRGMGRDTGIAGTENGMDAVHACTRRASAARFTFVAGGAGVVEVVAAGTL